ncbi:MAG: hypothetical protein AB1489_06810 [Acidobacteriota bacterium]
MDDLKIKFESSPKRCEICHQSDLFNAQANLCLRCAALNLEQEHALKEKKRSLDYIDIGLILGAMGGAITGIVGDIVKGFSLFQSSSYWGIAGLTMVGAIWGAITGAGIKRLRKY